MRNDDFDWSDGCFVEIPPQRRTAVYPNTAGDVVFRQAMAWDEDEDPVMIFSSSRENMARLIYGMIEAAELPWQIVEATERGWIDVDNPNDHRQREREGQQTLLKDCLVPEDAETDKPAVKDPTAAERQRRRRQRLREEAATNDGTGLFGDEDEQQ